MPLPLPDLDDRRWTDLVDEARALLPRLAPGWTDYNASDPGITVLELLAWLTEADVFGVDRIPASHRARFVALTGIRSAPVQPARTPLRFATVDAAPLRLPSGIVFAATVPGQTRPVRHQLRVPVSVLGCPITAVQSYTGSGYLDRTPDWRHGAPFDAVGPDPAGPASGSDPDGGSALLIGFDPAVPLDPDARLSLWLGCEDAATVDPAGDEPGPTGESSAGDEPEQVGVVTAWEYHDGAAWQPFAALPGDPVLDETRALTRSGRVLLPFGAVAGAASVLGAVITPHRWLRLRLLAGRPDVAPRLHAIVADAAPVVQASTGCTDWPLAAGHPPLPATFVVGATVQFGVHTDPRGRIVGFADPTATDPHALITSLPASGRDTVGLDLLSGGVTDGAPSFVGHLGGAPFTGVGTEVWLADEQHCVRWQVVDDLIRSGPADRHVSFDPATGALRFGDGLHGRVPGPAGTIVVRAEQTLGPAGTPTGQSRWQLATDDPHTAALTTAAPITAHDLSVWAAAGVPAVPADDLTAAAGRAAARMWAHERLLDLAPDLAGATLDQLDPAAIRSRPAPWRAATALDFERLALDVPGTAVLRARAWPGCDPAQPGAAAPGTVTVIVVPGLPAARPMPTAGLLTRVRRHLCPRRTLGTRLIVAGPDYVTVSVTASLQPLANADPARVQADALARLATYLHPLTGGPTGRGWPFGRDVYQAEILRQLDLVAGVDHVDDLELSVDGVTAGCGNVCVGPMQLVVSGTHRVSVAGTGASLAGSPIRRSGT